MNSGSSEMRVKPLISINPARHPSEMFAHGANNCATTLSTLGEAMDDRPLDTPPTEMLRGPRCGVPQ